MPASEPRPASDSTASADEGHAVRWAARDVRGEPDWTGWHWTQGNRETVCGRKIPKPDGITAVGLGWPGVTAVVDCKRCRKWLAGRSGG